MGRSPVLIIPELDRETHTYRLNGRAIPSVTQILEKSGFYEFPFASPEALARARELGTDVHKATELYDRGQLDYNSITDEVYPYLEGWISFRRDHRELEVVENEHFVYHPALDFAGTLDRVFQCDRLRIIADVKTGAALPATGMQTAAYRAAYNAQHRHDKRVSERMSIHLTETGKYKLIPHKDPSDFGAFCAALTLFHWREKNVSR